MSEQERIWRKILYPKPRCQFYQDEECLLARDLFRIEKCCFECEWLEECRKDTSDLNRKCHGSLCADVLKLLGKLDEKE